MVVEPAQESRALSCAIIRIETSLPWFRSARKLSSAAPEWRTHAPAADAQRREDRMPRYTKDQIHRGMRLEGGIFPADDPRREHIRKGMYLTVDGPRQVNHITQADAIQLLAARLQDVRKALEAPIGGKAKR
jgi:hypothetical protein